MIFSFLPVAPKSAEADLNPDPFEISFTDSDDYYMEGNAQVTGGKLSLSSGALVSYEINDESNELNLGSSLSETAGFADYAMGSNVIYLAVINQQDTCVEVEKWSKNIGSGAWLNDGLLGGSCAVYPNNADNIDVAVDSSGAPYVAYVDSSNQITIKKWGW